MNSTGDTHRAVRSAALVCLAVSLLVFGLRVQAVWAAANTAPGVAVTSGFEEESWFAMWRYAHGQPVFADPTRVPFAGTYFNWLFYGSYGCVAKQAVALSGDAAIPTAGRMLSGLLAFSGIAALAWMCRRASDLATSAALAAFAFTGPLVSWWALTVRPDIGALAFETLGLGLALRAMTDSRRRWILGAALAFFAAWSFKQSFVLGLVAVGACFVWRRAWRDAWWLAGSFTLMVAVTFIIGGASFRGGLAQTASVNEFYLAQGLDNLLGTLKKTAPLWVLPALMVVRWRTLGRAALEAHPACMQLCVIGLTASIGLSTVLSCKMGASTNYFFSALPFLVGLNVVALRGVGSLWLKLLPFVLASALQLLALTGTAGSVTLKPQSEVLTQMWSEWRTYPQPRFSSVTLFNLPWVSPESPPLMVAFNYPLQRRAGAEFEGGGIGGMITRGEFAALLLPEHEADRYDGASLERYVAEKRMFGFVFLRRKDQP